MTSYWIQSVKILSALLITVFYWEHDVALNDLLVDSFNIQVTGKSPKILDLGYVRAAQCISQQWSWFGG